MTALKILVIYDVLIVASILKRLNESGILNGT